MVRGKSALRPCPYAIKWCMCEITQQIRVKIACSRGRPQGEKPFLVPP